MNFMFADNLTKFNIITKFMIIVNPGCLKRKFSGSIWQDILPKAIQQKYLQNSTHWVLTSLSMFLSKIDLLHVQVGTVDMVYPVIY